MNNSFFDNRNRTSRSGPFGRLRTSPFGPSTRSRRDGLRAGVTLVEFLVAFGIFAVLVTIATGSFIRSTRIQRSALQLMAVNDNMGIAIEQMMREMRTGYNFCTQARQLSDARFTAQCAALGANEIQFVNAANKTMRYRFNGTALQRGEGLENWDPSGGNPCGAESEFDAVNGICYRTITADNVKVTNVRFEPFYNNAGDGYSPRIVMSFSMTSNDPMVQAMVAPITIQTTVSARCGESSCPSDS